MKRLLNYAVFTLFIGFTAAAQNPLAPFFQQKPAQLHPANHPSALKAAERGGQGLRLIGARDDEWDGAWQFSDSTRYTYSGSRLVEWVVLNFDSLAWENNFRKQYEYDTTGNLVTDQGELWTNNQWTVLYKTLNTYNTANQLDSSLLQYAAGGPLENSSLYVYTYDASGNQTGELSYFWSGTAWMTSSQTLNEYNAGNQLLRTTEQTWNGLAWSNSDRTECEYDANNKLVSCTDQDWTGASWENDSRTTYTYAANSRVTLALGEEWDGTFWVNSDKTENQYDANGKWTDAHTYDWDNNAWKNDEKIAINEALYDPNLYSDLVPNPLLGWLFHNYVAQEWNDSAGTWVNSYRYFGWFENFVGVENITQTFDCQVFPNPAHGVFTLSVKDAGVQPEQMVLFNMAGQQVASRRLQGVATQTVPLGQLPQGQYMLHISDKAGRQAVLPLQVH